VTTTVELIVTEPGVYDIPDAVYHADPVPGGSLSSSGARKLLPPYCPAIYDWERRNRRGPKKAFDFGHAAHREVLGVGPELAVLDYDDWRTKEARQKADEARAAGLVPILTKDYEIVAAMAAAIRAHPDASALFQTGRGLAEQSLFWPDERTGIWRRARLDWNPYPSGNRLIIPDYKTTESAHPEAIIRTVLKYGYHIQEKWYVDGIKALGLDQGYEPAFLFVFQEKNPPYLVTVAELHPLARRVATVEIRKAIDVYRECTRTGQWPGYVDDVTLIELPEWHMRRTLGDAA
jgi:hypothetical protein